MLDGSRSGRPSGPEHFCFFMRKYLWKMLSYLLYFILCPGPIIRLDWYRSLPCLRHEKMKAACLVYSSCLILIQVGKIWLQVLIWGTSRKGKSSARKLAAKYKRDINFYKKSQYIILQQVTYCAEQVNFKSFTGHLFITKIVFLVLKSLPCFHNFSKVIPCSWLAGPALSTFAAYKANLLGDGLSKYRVTSAAPTPAKLILAHPHFIEIKSAEPGVPSQPE